MEIYDLNFEAIMKKILFVILLMSAICPAQTPTGNIVPAVSGTRSLGTSDNPWLTGYINTLYWTTLSPAITTSSLGAQPALSGTGFVKISGSTISYDNSTYVTGTPWTAMGYLTTYTETDPSIYAWAKASVKPSYTYSEVGAQAPIANIADTSKYVEYSDSSGSLGWYRRAMEDAKFNAKQNIIANMADTSKYVEYSDSSTTNGWYRRAMSDAQLAAKAPLVSPSFTTPNVGVATGTSLAVTGAVTSSGAGIGYVSGAGGTVTQGSSRTTGVTLSKLSGTITMFSSAVAAAASSTFTWTNTFITATDIVIMEHNSTTNPACWKCEVICGAGTATVVVKNISAASITEATPLKFIVIKAANN
jgi:hypothetical protein